MGTHEVESQGKHHLPFWVGIQLLILILPEAGKSKVRWEAFFRTSDPKLLLSKQQQSSSDHAAQWS